MDPICDSDMSLSNYMQINMEALLVEAQHVQTQRPSVAWFKSDCNDWTDTKASKNCVLEIPWCEYNALYHVDEVQDDMGRGEMNKVGLAHGIQSRHAQLVELGGSMRRSHKSFDLPLLKQRSDSHLWSTKPSLWPTPTSRLSSRNNSCPGYSRHTQKCLDESMLTQQQQQEQLLYVSIFSLLGSDDEGLRDWQNEQPKAKRACLRNGAYK